MEFYLQALSIAAVAILGTSLYVLLLSPLLFLQRLRRNGLGGPIPTFPFGNLAEMSRRKDPGTTTAPSDDSSDISHDISSTVFPYFAQWRKSHGKVFVYWLGTEPFLYVADPEFLLQATSGSLGNVWGKPDVFKHDRKPLFGDGILMVEGEEWAHHRSRATAAFAPAILNGMVDTMVDSTAKLIDEWSRELQLGNHEIDIQKAVTWNAAEIIARTSFGLGPENCKVVHEKLISIQVMLFKKARLVGVPFSNLLHLRHKLRTEALGRELDGLLLSIIRSRKAQMTVPAGPQCDFLGVLIGSNSFTDRELIGECKTFFFAGHETTALSLCWTLLLLAVYPEWQRMLREEVMEVCQKGERLDSKTLAKLTKMEWVFNEVLRLYPPAPNFQRQLREDVRVGDVVIPKGTNMWVDLVGMHHDPTLWGEDVNEFKPDRFRESSSGGCKHRNGYLPFGHGGRMCIGRNLSRLEYKVVLTQVLRNFSLSLSPKYRQSPSCLLTLRPSLGVPLIVKPLEKGNCMGKSVRTTDFECTHASDVSPVCCTFQVHCKF